MSARKLPSVRIAVGAAVGVHQRHALAPAPGGAAFGDVGDARVEIAGLAGQALVDHVGDLVRDPPPLAVWRIEAQAAQLLAREHVPQPELDREQPARRCLDVAADQRLRVDLAPVGEPGLAAQLVGGLDVGAPVDHLEQAGAGEVRADHLGDRGTPLLRRRAVAGERADGDRHRLHDALGDVDAQLRHGRGPPATAAENAAAPAQHEAAAEPSMPLIRPAATDRS